MADRCPFCAIVAGDAPADVIHQWPDAIAFTPLNPVTGGHTLVIPRQHVEHALENPQLTGIVFERAATLARGLLGPCNLITSAGPAATQTVPHLHVHIVPRRDGDGLALPWTGQRAEDA